MYDLPPLLQRAADLLREARSAIALTGAGISTPSGIPDFRSADSGLWQNADPLEVASLAAFRYHPERFYARFRPLVHTIRQARPNPAHFALAELEAGGLLKTIITQNIDDLHHRAGSSQVLELHGHLREVVCGQCHQVWPAHLALDLVLAPQSPDAPGAGGTGVPRCASCGGVLKPQVILMGEQLRESLVREARDAVRHCDVMLVAGSSLEVMPVAGFPQEAVLRGARLIIVNREPTYVDEYASVVIRDDVAHVLPQIAAAALEGNHA